MKFDYPIIILDFDGVCTEFGDKTGSYITHSAENYGPSENPIRQLKKLISITGAKIVISSNWRKFTTDPNLRTSYWVHPEYGTILNPIDKLFKEFGNTIIGMLPPLRHARKPDAFRAWLIENDTDIADLKYVIFDDDPNEGFESSEFSDHFVKTDVETGLTAENIKIALKFLK